MRDLHVCHPPELLRFQSAVRFLYALLPVSLNVTISEDCDVLVRTFCCLFNLIAWVMRLVLTKFVFVGGMFFYSIH